MLLQFCPLLVAVLSLCYSDVMSFAWGHVGKLHLKNCFSVIDVKVSLINQPVSKLL